MKKKLVVKKKTAAQRLVSRVAQLEKDMLDVRGKMSRLGEDLSALRTAIKQVDDRTLRGERLMMDMQLDQRGMSRTLERIAVALNVPHHEEHPHPPPEPVKRKKEE